jgi:protoheme IX farnesyltransferase
MSARTAVAQTTALDLLSLAKPRLSALVVCTTAGGMWVAPGSLSAASQLLVLLATAGTVAAANVLNCYLERDSDRLMARTQNRPLPSRRMDPQLALGFGLTLAAVFVPALGLVANGLTAVLGLVALATYVLVYTPMKAKSHAAMVVGAVPGALPPLMGWTATTGGIEPGGVVLFAILFLWQMPHFIAIALFRKEEYAAASLKALPLVKGDEVSRRQIVGYLLLLWPASLMLYSLRLAGPYYLGVALVAGGVFLGMGLHGLLRRGDRVWAKKLFLYSLVYLSLLFLALGLDGGPVGAS